MAKFFHEVCDFCGGELGHPHGILQAPRKFDSRVASLLSAIAWRTTAYREFDICSACCDGLTAGLKTAIDSSLLHAD